MDEWYINMDWRDEIKEIVKQIQWIPEWGQERELEWLTNMRDWMISKKRYWGLALPIWVCEDCKNFEVIGGREELKERAVEGWDVFDGHSPHRPLVDAVKIRARNAAAWPIAWRTWATRGWTPVSCLTPPCATTRIGTTGNAGFPPTWCWNASPASFAIGSTAFWP